MKKRIPKSFRWKARMKGHRMWNYFSARKRAKQWAGKEGQIRKR